MTPTLKGIFFSKSMSYQKKDGRYNKDVRTLGTFPCNAAHITLNMGMVGTYTISHTVRNGSDDIQYQEKSVHSLKATYNMTKTEYF